MDIDGTKIHKRLTPRLVMHAVERRLMSLDNPGFCVVCGAEAEGVEPDARKYTCESCGSPAVYGAEELMLYV